MPTEQTNLLFFNGINASTGDYLIPPLPAEELVQIVRGESFAPDHLMELKWREAQRTQSHYGVKEGVDPKDLAQTGWGVIFAADAEPALRDALRELLDYRREQANRSKDRYREYSGASGYRPGESKNLFLARQGAGPGPVDPDTVPYYLLIVGDPEKIPYAFQYQLDVAYAVGRIHFETLDEYAQYAQSVVRAEREQLARPRHAAFFGVANPDDGSTQFSAERLVKPLAEQVKTDQPTWTLDTYLAESATKARLECLLGGAETPALLFTASHGLAFDLGDPRQLKQQGAIVTQDWLGPESTRGRAIPQTMYYAADDVMSDARLFGLIAFHFACFGAGTPRFDEFAHLRQGLRERTQIAPHSFLAKLPKRILAHPKGGALAVVGHVDRAWGSSFVWNQSVDNLSVFQSALKRLMEGHPIGSALEFFNERYAELATALSSELEEMKYGKKIDPVELALLWTANNDARGYAIVGDPAVRLMVAPPNGDAAPTVRETIAVAGRDRIATGVDDSAEPDVSPTRLYSALEQLATTLNRMAQEFADDQPIEITTALGDARITSQVRADGGVSTVVQGIIGEHLLNVHTRLVHEAQQQRIESLRAVIEAAKQTLDMIRRSSGGPSSH
ncbi:MAG TPA: hypothetical protein VFD70_17750 [Anaerolineae bacterium]|nr:hypothetical protein [Anaerolineae bacterium]